MGQCIIIYGNFEKYEILWNLWNEKYGFCEILKNTFYLETPNMEDPPPKKKKHMDQNSNRGGGGGYSDLTYMAIIATLLYLERDLWKYF